MTTEAGTVRPGIRSHGMPTMIARGCSQLLVGLSLFALLAMYEFEIRRGKGFQSSQLKALPHGNYGRERLWGVSPRRALDSTEPNCSRKCGDVLIPYPFGLSIQCARSPNFTLECTNNLGQNISAAGEGPWPLLTHGNGNYTVDRYNNISRSSVRQEYAVNAFQVERIDPGFMIINVTAIKAMGCWSTNGKARVSLDPVSPYWISEENEFFVAGCDSSCSYELTPVTDPNWKGKSSCGPLICANQRTVPFCQSYACCVQPIKWAKTLSLSGGGIGYSEFENCGFCSIIHRSTFYPPGKHDVGIGRGTYGLQLAWAIVQTDRESCSAAQVDTESYECSQHATCQDSTTPEKGYFCLCDLPGYWGDGYKKGTRCEDIDECVSGHNCTEVAECKNIAGSYECNCPPGMTGDGINERLNASGTGCTWPDKCEDEELNNCSKDAKCTFDGTTGIYSCSCQGNTVGDGHDGEGGTGCKPKYGKSKTAIVVGVSTAAGVFLAINLSLLWFIYRRRRRAYELALFSAKDLVDELEKHEGAKYCKIFTYSDLQKATNDFSPDRKLGEGGFGTVFEGILKDGTKVAVKRAGHELGETRSDAKQFVNEIVILSQVNHRYLVRLMGCCLETQVPVLVYEFVSNGDLQEHIKFSSNVANESDTKICLHPPLNWNQRLKIAVETAEALSYLHWGTTPPIYHHDIKCANILLDNDYNVKVADFGLSKLVSLDSTVAATKRMGGTPGYLDPAFFDSCQLTDKSDVYSYGIVLLVLLTGQKPVDFARPPRDQNLAMRCERLIAEGLLIVNLDPELGSFLHDSNVEEAISAVVKVAMKCVSRFPDDRPTMKEVLSKLQAIETGSRERKSSKSKQVRFLDGDAILLHDDGRANSSTFSYSSQSSSFQIEWPNSGSGLRAGKTSVDLGSREDKVSPR